MEQTKTKTKKLLFNYYILLGGEYWKPDGRGYTTKKTEAGVFTLEDMIKKDFNLDGCTLVRAPGHIF